MEPGKTEMDGSKKRWTRNLLVAGVFVLGLIGVELIVAGWMRNAQHLQRENVVLKAAEVRGSLENAVNSAAHLASGLVSFVRAVPNATDEQITTALRSLYETDSRIRNLGIAPDNVLNYLYPLEGNEAAVGLRYEEVPSQWPEVKRAMEERQAVLAGPVNLVQGGVGLINRTPVFLDNGDYFGLISLVIDVDRLLGKAGIRSVVDGVKIHVQGGDQSRAGDSAWVLGEGQFDRQAAVTMKIQVPGGQWTLFAEPENGWDDFSDQAMYLRLIGFSGLLLGAAFLMIVLESRAKARSLASSLQALNRELSSSNSALEYLSHYDELTRVANRRHFDETLQKVWAANRRQGIALAVLMIDADHFKDINDHHGHQTGDKCLSALASRILSCLMRADDFVARYGGEEFVVLASGQSPDQAAALAEKIRQSVMSLRIESDVADAEPIRMTVSVGVAVEVPSEGRRPENLCRAADLALYRAKQEGRNCVRLSEVSEKS